MGELGAVLTGRGGGSEVDVEAEALGFEASAIMSISLPCSELISLQNDSSLLNQRFLPLLAMSESNRNQHYHGKSEQL
jgi:hypothetical protein